MPGKKSIIAIIIIILALLLWWFFSLMTAPKTNNGGSNNVIGSLFPFGTSSPTTPNNNSNNTAGGNRNETPATNPTSPEAPYDPLIQVTDKVIAGFTSLPAPTDKPLIMHDVRSLSDPSIPATTLITKIPTLRFMEAGTGYVYDIETRGENERKVTETNFPQALIALFTNQGKNVIVRFIKNDNVTVSTYFGNIIEPTGTQNGELKGTFMDDNIEDVAVSPDKKTVVMLTPTATGIAGTTMKADGTGKKQIFKSDFTEWLIDLTNKTIGLTTKASYNEPGYTYTVDSSGILKRTLPTKNGLTTNTSPDGNIVLYSESTGTGVRLHIYNQKTGSDNNTGLQTLPEKCTWSTDSSTAYCGVQISTLVGQYPDDWYQGTLHMDDAFWKVDIKTNSTSEINDGEGRYLDITNPSIDQTGRYLLIVNKNDGSLWSLDLNPPKKATPKTDTAPALPTTN